MKGVSNLAVCVGIWLAVSVASFGLGLIAVAIWAALVFLGAEARAQKAQALLERTLMTGETITVSAVQHRVFALFKRRTALAITSSRVIAVQRGLIGGFKMADMQWKDLSDVRLEQNILEAMCGSNLAFEHLVAETSRIAVDGVPSETAGRMYARAQHEEQAWEEKRRVRGLEEMRAQAGGVTVNGGGDSGADGARMVEEIGKAKGLLDAGAISDAEFQEMKAKILGRA